MQASTACRTWIPPFGRHERNAVPASKAGLGESIAQRKRPRNERGRVSEQEVVYLNEDSIKLRREQMLGGFFASCGRLERIALPHTEPAAEPVDQAHGKAPHGRRMTRRDPTVRIEPKPDYYLIGGPSVGRAPPKRTSLPRHAIGAHHGDMLIRSLTGQEEPYGARVGFAPDTVRVFAPPLPVAALQQLVGESPDLSVPRGYYIVRDWGVYGRYDFAQLPPLPFPMNPTSRWAS